MNRIGRFRQLLLIGAVWMYLHPGAIALHATGVLFCSDVCPSSTCDSSCYETQFDYDNDNPTTCFNFGSWDQDYSCCGDGQCTAGENGSNCNVDCHCGDGVCNSGETCNTCPSDCTCNGGSGTRCGVGSCVCDGYCDTAHGETVSNCPEDCNGGHVCGDGTCEDTEVGGAGTPYNNNCNPDLETNTNECEYCAIDCDGCDPGYCWPQLCDSAKPWKCKACHDCSDCPSGYYCAGAGSDAAYCQWSDQGSCQSGQCSGETCITQCNICGPSSAR
jgi:hypothetical protein